MDTFYINPNEPLVIDGPIHRYGFSQQLLRNYLGKNKKNKVTIEVSSLGGDLSHGLSMNHLIAEHGQVNIKMYGFIASAATLLALSAHHTSISENAFYLIHKVMTPVIKWEHMNEDELEEYIKELEADKQDVAKMTAQAAKMYTARAKEKGKTLEEVLELMTIGRWLTAQEALEWGFVDEIYKPTKAEKEKQTAKQAQYLNIINAAQLPFPINTGTLSGVEVSTPSRTLSEVEMSVRSGEKSSTGESAACGSFAPSQSTGKTPFPQSQNNSTGNTQISQLTKSNTMTKQFQHINTTLDIEGLVLTEEGSYLSEEQLTAIEEGFQSYISSIEQTTTEHTAEVETLTTANKELSTQVETLTNEKTELEGQLQAETEKISQLQAKVDELTALIDKLPKNTPNTPNPPIDPKKSKDGVNWDIINALPHNKEIDKY